MNLKIQAILFDFDGTLVQSNQIKRDMLFVVARTVECPENPTPQPTPASCLRNATAWQVGHPSTGGDLSNAPPLEGCRNGGVGLSAHRETSNESPVSIDQLFAQVFDDHPRYDRFGLYRELLTRMNFEGDIDTKVDELTTLYGELTTSAISKAPEIPGAEEFLKEYSSQIPMYINSATPEASLRISVEKRGWTGFFRGVYGRPKSKNDIVDLVKKEAGLPAEQILFVGDSVQDLDSARDNGCPFLGVAHEPGWHYAFPENVPVLQHYRDFFTLSARAGKL